MMEVCILLQDKEGKADIGKLSFLFLSFCFDSKFERDGLAHQSLLDGPWGITVNLLNQSIYITEYSGHRIRKLFRLQWTKEIHSQFTSSIRNQILTIMTMSVRRGTLFNKLPRDILFAIIQILSTIDNL